MVCVKRSATIWPKGEGGVTMTLGKCPEKHNRNRHQKPSPPGPRAPVNDKGTRTASSERGPSTATVLTVGTEYLCGVRQPPNIPVQ
jgi:hypothetical protein